MTCPRCGTEFKTIACPACLERASREAVMRAQPDWITKARTGQCDFILARFQQHKPHVQLFGDPNHAFCGQPLAEFKRTKLPYVGLTPDAVCPQCFRIVAGILKTTVEAL